MGDAAFARREARRRKILENSHNRLQIISGKSVNDITKESSSATPIARETAEKSVPKDSNSVVERCLNNGVININTSEDPISVLSINHESFAMGDGRVAMQNDSETIYPHFRPDTPQEDTQTTVEWYSTIPKYDIVGLPALLHVLYSFTSTSEEELEKSFVFLPFFLYITVKYYLFPSGNNANIVNVLLLINGMSHNRAQKFMQIAHFASAFFQDICIYLFSTICLKSLLHTLQENFG